MILFCGSRNWIGVLKKTQVRHRLCSQGIIVVSDNFPIPSIPPLLYELGRWIEHSFDARLTSQTSRWILRYCDSLFPPVLTNPQNNSLSRPHRNSKGRYGGFSLSPSSYATLMRAFTLLHPCLRDPDGIALAKTDLTSRIIDWNEQDSFWLDWESNENSSSAFAPEIPHLIGENPDEMFDLSRYKSLYKVPEDLISESEGRGVVPRGRKSSRNSSTSPQSKTNQLEVCIVRTILLATDLLLFNLDSHRLISIPSFNSAIEDRMSRYTFRGTSLMDDSKIDYWASCRLWWFQMSRELSQMLLHLRSLW